MTQVRVSWMLIASIALFAAGCTGSGSPQGASPESAHTLRDVDSLKALLREIRGLSLATPSRVQYQLSDVARNSKAVGAIYSDVQIAKGDRVFLGDDMWDVAFVKVYTHATTSNADQHDYLSGSVELLVTFAGKAKDASQTR